MSRSFDYAAIREAHGRLKKPGKTAREIGCSIPTVKRALRMRDLNDTFTRSPSGPGLSGHGGISLPKDHAVVLAGTALFPNMVRPVGAQSLFKGGVNSGKIGGTILKGKWRGLPVYTLTLEERATCPRSCNHWLDCYGNNSPYSIRFEAGEAFERRVEGEINDLAMQHRDGFAVRLHNLGDFYSVAYVRLWADLLDRHPELHVFGFTARWDCKKDPIALALARLVLGGWERFAVRFSDAPVDECSTISIAHAADKPADAVICPQQVGRTESCSTCALCWQSRRRIAFVRH